MEKKIQQYYIGLDMGTGSVGWAVTDEKYDVIKRHGKALWGVRLFQTAETAKERRMFRTSRRRLERRKNRLLLLQEIFAEEISKVDPGFYQRMKESKYWPEDKKDINGKVPALPYALFADEQFTDKEYHQKYPTIYHLRYELASKMNEKPDIRLVYLALHHIIKYRGHFLFEGRNMSEVDNFETAINMLEECAKEQEIDLNLTEETIEELEKILKNKKSGRAAKKTEVINLINPKTSKKDVQKQEIAKLLTGCSATLSNLFHDKALEEEEIKKICFSDKSYEENEEKIESILADRFLLIVAAKAVYDWSVLHDILQDSKYLSEAKIKTYEKHKNDLKKVKQIFKNDKKLYNKVFGTLQEKDDNYSRYIGMGKKNGKKQSIEKKCSREEFYTFLKKQLKNIDVNANEENKQLVEEIQAEIENETLFPKQKIGDNAVIPYQLHEKELIAILENAKKYYPFLVEEDEDGYSAIQKVEKIFQFRIPYYVGPLNTIHKDKGGNSWAVRKKEGQKIYPWNFEKIIDEEESATKFIERMTNKCTYLVGEDVLPKESLLYAKFNVLNELNNVRIDGNLISVEVKQKIYNGVFKKYERVTGKKLKDFLLKEGIMTRQQELTGFDQNFKSSLKAYHDIKQIVGENVLSDFEQEDIIRDITLFGDSQSMLKTRIKRKYPSLTEKQVKQLAAKKYNGWGRFSKAFLEEILSVNKETGEIINIITALWETNDNLMQLLSQNYDYAKKIEKRNASCQKEGVATYEDIEQLYVSPAVKRPIWQTLKLVQEIEHIMENAPSRIFIEMAREGGKKGIRTESRRKKLVDLYKTCKQEEAELYEKLCKETDNALRGDKLYLYYTQMGRCMYSGEKIDLEDLFTKSYDIDHIYPQAKVMDNSIDNRVLVKRELNGAKGDNFPVPEQYVKNAKWLWDTLLSKGFISKEKYKRLTRRETFDEGELSNFIARQLVETRQSTKAVAHLLEKTYGGNSEIIYAKAAAVSQFRQKFDIIKVRSINDYHHAKDAYLNIVVGNAYFVKFTKDAAWFVHNNPGRTYHLQKMFEKETIKRKDEIAWIPGSAGTIQTVKKWMRKNNILFTRKAYEVKGEFYKQNLLKKGKGQIPIKGGSDKRLEDIQKYGAYNGAKGAYFMLVQSKDKKGNLQRTIEFVPVYLAKKLENSKQLQEQYCREKLGLAEPDVRLSKIKIDTLFVIDGFKVHLSGRQPKRLILKGANQLVLSEPLQKTMKKVEKYCARHTADKSAVLSAKDEVEEEDLQKVYDEFCYKLEHTIYSKKLSGQLENLKEGRGKFTNMSKEEKCLVLGEILHLFQCNSQEADLKLLVNKKTGKLTMSNNITKMSNIYLVNQSITGFFEQVIDLQTI